MACFSFSYKQKYDGSKEVQSINKFKDFLNCKNFDGQKGIGLCNIQEACDTLGANLKITIINGSKCTVVTNGDSKNAPLKYRQQTLSFEIENICLEGKKMDKIHIIDRDWETNQAGDFIDN